jgi:hypothetical protein
VNALVMALDAAIVHAAPSWLIDCVPVPIPLDEAQGLARRQAPRFAAWLADIAT